MRANSGFTLLELLIAAGILVVLLGTLGGMYVSSTRAYETNRAVTEASGQLRTAVQAIQRDFSQAGYAGTATEASFQALDFDLGESTDQRFPVNSLTLRYMEHASDTAETAITYEVTEGRLVRHPAGQDPQPLAEGIDGLFVTAFVLPEGMSTTNPQTPAGTQGLELLLAYTQGSGERIEEFRVVMP